MIFLEEVESASVFGLDLSELSFKSALIQEIFKKGWYNYIKKVKPYYSELISVVF